MSSLSKLSNEKALKIRTEINENFKGFKFDTKGTSKTPRLTVEVNNGVKTINGKPVK